MITLALGVAFGIVAFLTLRTYAEDIFLSIQPHTPTNEFRSLECPATLGIDQTEQIIAEIANPIADTLVYSVAINAPDFTILQAASSEITVPGNNAAQVTWVIKSLAMGHHPVIISALSDKDLVAPGPYKSWPTSFHETCFVDVGAFPGLSQERVILISGAITIGSIVTGLVLWFWWVYRRLKPSKP